MKIIFKYFLILFTVLLYVSGCQADNPEINISAEEFLNMKETTESLILDVRTNSEYSAGHLEHAVLINLRDSDFSQKIKELDKNKIYYVYCLSGVRSRSAVIRMRKEGIEKAYNIKGGINALIRNGAELTK
jgi:rhodanese-related sulfurtransferase